MVEDLLQERQSQTHVDPALHLVHQQIQPLHTLRESARKGEEIKLDSRKVTIDTFELTEIDLPKVKFRVVCSKGTYIRSLVYDFGKAVESGAHMTALRRTKIGDFDVKDALSPSQFVDIAKQSQNTHAGN